jgi:hypothetical protein
MYKVFIIGNGFDLAHGLNTRYSDFMLWLINKMLRLLTESKSYTYNNPLISITNQGFGSESFNSLSEVKKAIEYKLIKIEYKNEFLRRLFDKYLNANWVDVEYEYYQVVLAIYKKSLGDFELDIRRIVKLNRSLDMIKAQLAEYLQTLPAITTYLPSVMHNFKEEMSNVTPEDLRVVVFNYTNTIEKYAYSLGISRDNIIYIHGKLDTPDNPIIFGYGDEIDEDYRKLENLNNNEILRNMKSFSYFKTINYQALNRFLKGLKLYDVVIMGHSCGISDRVLLNSIFTRAGCNSIKIYYHRKNETETDYFEKTQEISRHFKSEEKSRMRDLIVPFPQSSPLS